MIESMAVPVSKIGKRSGNIVKSRKWKLSLAAGALICGVWVGIRAWQAAALDRSFQKALAALDRKDTTDVVRYISMLSDVPRLEAHTHLLRGGVNVRRRRFQDALRHLAQSPPVGDLRASALTLMGECLHGLGRLKEAIKLFEIRVWEAPRDIDARRWLSAICYDLGEIGAAIRHLEQLIKMVPDDYRLHRFLGRIYHDDLKQYLLAADEFRRALGLDPPPILREAIRIDLAQALFAAGLSEAALEEVEDCEANVEGLALKADCLWQLDRQSLARNALAAAQQIDRDARSVIMLEARWRIDEGNLDQAVAMMRHMLELDPHDFPCRYQLALAYQRAGDVPASRAEMERMQEAKEFRTRLSELYFKSRRLDDADVRDEIAALCEEVGKHDMAEIWRNAAQVSRSMGPSMELDPKWFQRQSISSTSTPL